MIERTLAMTMDTLPVRLSPGQDLRRAIEDAVTAQGCTAAFVLSGIGSLSHAQLRFAGAADAQAMSEDMEILTLAGSIAAKGSHLHASLSGSTGEVIGGHLAYGCVVRTTAEVLLVLLHGWQFTREPDAATGYDELVVRKKEAC